MGDHAVVTRHEFLAELHKILNPRVYLEIGVQSGASLTLATGTRIAHGVDPHPMLSMGIPPWAQIFEETSDEYFAALDRTAELTNKPSLAIDLGFIDGMHLWEYALRDFMNMERYANSHGTIVLDDVLPYNREIAARKQPPGDWTGDVWKVWEILSDWRPDLDLRLVNSQPTGLLVVRNLNPYNRILKENWASINRNYGSIELTDSILNREWAFSPEAVLNWIKLDIQERAERGQE
jgi:hypothetical protein